jgi:hypothetical protein
VVGTWPASGSQERQVQSIVVSFDRPVLNVSADDLTLSAGTVVSVQGSGNGGYAFTVTGVPYATITATIGGDIASDGGLTLPPYQWTFTNLLIGDGDGDGHVDVTDLLYLVDAFGSVTGDANYNPACDFNTDGAVDVVDLLMMIDNWGT